MSATEFKITSQRNLRSLAFKPGGVLVGGDESGAIHQWSVEDRLDVSGSGMQFEGTVYAAVVSADGQWIVTSGLGGLVIVWNAVTHQRVIEVKDHDVYPGHVCTVDVSSDSKRFASGSHDKTVRIFDITSGTRLVPPLRHPESVVGVKFSPDASRIATITQIHAFLGIYNAFSGDKLLEFPVAAQWAPITPLAWSPDGQKLFAASQGKITYLDVSTSSRSEWPIHDNNSQQVSIVTNGTFIACSAGSSVTFWDLSSHEQIRQILTHDEPITCVAISFDGRYLATGDCTGITIRKLEEFLPERYLTLGISCLPLMQVTETVMKSWVLGMPAETESILSEEIAGCSKPSHYAYATRALMRAHLREWKTAIEDAEMSLKIKLSPIGQIARSVALAGNGKQEVALDDFDLAFRDCDLGDNKLLLAIKSILVFTCSKREQAISRLRSLIAGDDETTRGFCFQILGNMHLKQGDYKNAVQTLDSVKNPFTTEERGPLMTISIVFNWDFENLKLIAWERLCQTLYTSRSLKELGETLLKIASHSTTEEEKEAMHGQILQEIVTRSREFTILPFGEDELEKRAAELRKIFPVADALVTYSWITRSQPVRFTHFRLHLPCIVFRAKRLQRLQRDVYCAETAALGDVEFTTGDSLSLKDARRLVFVNPWIHLLRDACGSIGWDGDNSDSDTESNTNVDVDSDAEAYAELMHAPMIEEIQPTPPDTDMDTRALRLIAFLGQSFSALLLLKQPDGAYKRVAADHEIVIRGMGNNVPRDIRVELLEVV
ncbi:WD40-repeat-containing domain protein [Chiua virens]|nr:WD40-repeat-containing domain protein [Chiua virens]